MYRIWSKPHPSWNVYTFMYILETTPHDLPRDDLSFAIPVAVTRVDWWIATHVQIVEPSQTAHMRKFSIIPRHGVGKPSPW